MKKYYLLFLSVIALIVISDVIYSFRKREYNINSEISRFQERFIEKEKIAINYVDEVLSLIQKNDISIVFEMDFLKYSEKKYQNNRISLFIADGNSLLFWSDNDIPLKLDEMPNVKYGLEANRNGFYYFIKTQEDNLTIWTYFLLKRNYKYQNRFLINEFSKGFELKQDFWLSCNPALGYAIYSNEGNYAFSLVPMEFKDKTESRTVWIISLFMAIIALALFSYSTLSFIKNKKPNIFNTKYKAFIILVALLGIRLILFCLKTPEIFYQSKLFSPGLYASSIFLPSLGDLFLHVLFFTFLVYFLFSYAVTFKKWQIKNYILKIFAASGMFAIILIFNILILYLINTLVFNSQLQLNVNFINEINLYNITGLVIIGLLFFSLYFLSSFLIENLTIIIDELKIRLITGFTTLFIVIVFWKLFLTSISGLWILLCVLPFIMILSADKKTKVISHRLSNIIIALFIFCLTITISLFTFYKHKEISTRKTLALSLSIEQDPIAEYLFYEIEDKLFNDRDLINLVARNPYDISSLTSYLQSKYFYDYWAKYDLQITVCAPDELLIIRPANIQMDCLKFFEDYISEFGKPTISDRLVFLDNNTGRSSYIVKIPVELIFVREWDINKYYLYLEFDSKFVPRDLGFPELLLDEGIEFPGYLNVYSYAVYKNGLLINKFGPYFYSTNVSVYGDFENEFEIFDFDSYNHLYFKKDDETVLIVSKPLDSILEKIAPFSYLFILYFLLLMIFWGYHYDFKNILYFKMNFKSRLQATMIIIVLVSLISVVSISAWFIYNIYTNKNKDFINEKAYSVLTEMEHQILEFPIFDREYEAYLNDVLLKMSNVFYTDINVYSPEGILLGSSRSRVFEEGLISELMDPHAFYHLKGHKQILFVHHERIGKLKYLSAYLPLRGHNNEIIAYINLPYFAKHGELRSEISHFLVAFINIYLLLLVLAIVLALFVSGYVTRPLQMLKNSISNVIFGGENVKIDWKKNDEIGQLVQEYNRMIDELETSAKLLAQSERESAWREMAKQVAHEIKNPLTPMKLSVQYLEKAWEDKVSDWDEHLKRFVNSIIEQIDNLSEIASAFSDFAKMPAGKFDNLDMKEFIAEIVELYKGYNQLNIVVHDKVKGKMIVYADKKQMTRVFNNLINNAIQAYDKTEIAVIEIVLFNENANHCIEIKDYGQGIAEDFKKHIFKPYFTTKTGGLGLGLAMVKSIIEGFGGVVGFQSSYGAGSSFYIRIPQK